MEHRGIDVGAGGTRRRWAAFGAGAALFLVWEVAQRALAGPPLPPPGPVAFWAADRLAQRVIALDGELGVVRRLALDWPADVEPCADGGLWVLRSSDGSANGLRRLVRLRADGSLETELTTGLVRDLDVLAGRDALLVELGASPGDPPRALRVGPEGAHHLALEVPDLACIAGSGETIALGAAGEVLRVDASGALLARADVGRRIVDLAPGPEPGSLWALDAGPGRRLVRLDAALALLWRVEVGLEALHLAPEPGAERVWLADTAGPRARRFGAGGLLEVDREELPLDGLDRALALAGGGALLVAPGAILRLDARGATVPGQGGFAELADVARAR